MTFKASHADPGARVPCAGSIVFVAALAAFLALAAAWSFSSFLACANAFSSLDLSEKETVVSEANS